MMRWMSTLSLLESLCNLGGHGCATSLCMICRLNTLSLMLHLDMIHSTGMFAGAHVHVGWENGFHGGGPFLVFPLKGRSTPYLASSGQRY